MLFGICVILTLFYEWNSMFSSCLFLDQQTAKSNQG